MGGQRGHKGRTLRQVEKPDKVHVHLPEHCAVCGRYGYELNSETLETALEEGYDLAAPVEAEMAVQLKGA
jgi:hypothetical protein